MGKGQTTKLTSAMKPDFNEEAENEVSTKKGGAGKFIAIAAAGLVVVAGIAFATKFNSSKAKAAEVSAETQSASSESISTEEVGTPIMKLTKLSKAQQKIISYTGEEYFNKNVVENWGSSEILGGFNSVGYVFITKTDDAAYDAPVNKLYEVYEVTVNNNIAESNGQLSKSTTYYWYVAYKNLFFKGEEELSYDQNDVELPQGQVTVDSGMGQTWVYSGAASVDAVKNAIVAANPGYDIDVNIK